MGLQRCDKWLKRELSVVKRNCTTGNTDQNSLAGLQA
jgi:hypothetical protein